MNDESQEMEYELAFLSAMRAFRAARDSGDAEAIAQAEKTLQEVVRGELQAQNTD
ncbi:MAG: hypothetical protein IKG21_07880 [Atopobiaceae bacterium]|nr:hypothetical protein [Atopobiaceae bacterium]